MIREGKHKIFRYLIRLLDANFFSNIADKKTINDILRALVTARRRGDDVFYIVKALYEKGMKLPFGIKLVELGPEVLEFYIAKGVISPREADKYVKKDRYNMGNLAQTVKRYEGNTEKFLKLLKVLYKLGIKFPLGDFSTHYTPELIKFYIDNGLLTKNELRDKEVMTELSVHGFLTFLVQEGYITREEAINSIREIVIYKEDYAYLKPTFDDLEYGHAYIGIITDGDGEFMDLLIKDGLTIDNIPDEQLEDGLSELFWQQNDDREKIEVMLNKLLSIGLSRKTLDKNIKSFNETSPGKSIDYKYIRTNGAPKIIVI